MASSSARAISRPSTRAARVASGRAADDPRHGGAFGVVAGMFRSAHRFDALQGESGVEPFAAGDQQGALDGAREFAGRAGGDGGQFGQRRAQGIGAFAGREAEQEGGLIEAIGAVLGFVDQRQQRGAVARALAGLAGGDGQAVGFFLQPFGALAQALALVEGSEPLGKEGGLDHAGEHAGQAEMAQHEGEDLALGAVEPLREIGLDFVADQAGRAPVLQALAGDVQHIAQEGVAFALAERPVERHAIGDAAGRGVADRLIDQFRAAEFEKGAMAFVMARGRRQDLDRRRLAGEDLQGLARLVPVDQEDDARAQDFEVAVQIGRIAGREGAGKQIKRLALGEIALPLLGERAPGDFLPFEQGDEEFGAAAMDVGVGRGRRQPFDAHDQHMGVGDADIVLDREAGAEFDGGGRQPRVAKGQGGGPIEAAHESRDAGARKIVEARAMRAVHALDGGLGRQAVDEAMQVHHQQMHAVAGLATGGAERRDLPVGDAVALESGQGRELGLQPRSGSRRPRRFRPRRSARPWRAGPRRGQLPEAPLRAR